MLPVYLWLITTPNNYLHGRKRVSRQCECSPQSLEFSFRLRDLSGRDDYAVHGEQFNNRPLRSDTEIAIVQFYGTVG